MCCSPFESGADAGRAQPGARTFPASSVAVLVRVLDLLLGRRRLLARVVIHLVVAVRRVREGQAGHQPDRGADEDEEVAGGLGVGEVGVVRELVRRVDDRDALARRVVRVHAHETS